MKITKKLIEKFIGKKITSEMYKSILKMRKETESVLPVSCVKCEYRSIDGAPEPIPICTHPKHKTWKSMFIIDYKNPPLKRPALCPLMKKLRPKKFV